MGFLDLFRTRKPMQRAVPPDLQTSLMQGKCPDCGGETFLFGPTAGIMTNVECARCGNNFNVGVAGGAYLVDRIGWNLSGRWERPGVLKTEPEPK